MRRWATASFAFVVLIFMVPSGGESAVPGKPFTQTGCEGYSDTVARLYTAGLGRQPEEGGFEFWMDEYKSGRRDLANMATFFTQSEEFEASYGQLTQDGFIRQLYRNVLGREGESGGIAFWNQQMSAGMDRGTTLLRFAESPENITNSGTVDPILGPFNEGLPGAWTCVTEFQPLGPSAPSPTTSTTILVTTTTTQEVTTTTTRPGNPGDTKNCGDFGTQAEAQAWHDRYFPFYGDIAKLDRDNDGRVCESLP